MRCSYAKLVEVALHVEKSLKEKRSITSTFSGEEERKSIGKERSSKRVKSSFSQGSRWCSDQKLQCK